MAKLLIGKLHFKSHLQHGHMAHTGGSGSNLEHLKNMLKTMEIKAGSVCKKKKVVI